MFGIIGAVLALLGCLLGNVFVIIGFVSQTENISLMQTVIEMDYTMIPQVMIEIASPIDALFYGIAIYEGYKFSFRRFTEADLGAVPPA